MQPTGNKVYYILGYKKGMVKMYLLLKLMQVPWSIKTTLRFVSSSLICTPATYLFLDHLIKTNQKPTKKGCVCVRERELKTVISNSLYTLMFSVLLWLLCFTSALAGNGVLNRSPGMKSFPKKPQKIVHFILAFLSFFCFFQLFATFKSV